MAAFVTIGTSPAAAPAQSIRLAAGAATGSAPVPVGVQDSWVNKCAHGNRPNFHPVQADPSIPAVDSPHWQALGITTVRFSPPWDIADHAPGSHVQVVQDCFDHWLGQLAAHHVQPEVAFTPDKSLRASGHVRIPTLPVYTAAMKAFFARYGGQVKIVAPWGEPEFRPQHHPSYKLASGKDFDSPTCSKPATDANCGPVLAAQMWVAVHRLCSACTVIAGDFGSDQSKDFQYLSVYRKYLRDIHGGSQVYRPTVWAIHPYTDVLRWEHELKNGLPHTAAANTLVAHFAAQLKKIGYHGRTQIWLDEISSFTKNHHGETYSRAIQATAARDLLTQLVTAGGASTPGQPVVKRIYYLRFAGDTPDALIVKGTPEPVYRVFADRRKPHAASRPPTHAAAVRPTKKAAATRPTRRAAAAHPAQRRSMVGSSATSPPSQVAVPPRPASAATGRYELRDTADNLCLDANDIGPTAGRNGDAVQLWTCDGNANQSWSPVARGSGLVWLVNAMYPTKCLNADNIGGLAAGHRVQLWDCYGSPNELWNLANTLGGAPSQPLILGADSPTFVLDADKYHLGNGDKVQIWNSYGAANQLWSATPTQ
jgi:hypothetical protein